MVKMKSPNSRSLIPFGSSVGTRSAKTGEVECDSSRKGRLITCSPDALLMVRSASLSPAGGNTSCNASIWNSPSASEKRMFSKERYSAAGLASCPNATEDISRSDIRTANPGIRGLRGMLLIRKAAYPYDFQLEHQWLAKPHKIRLVGFGTV